MHEMFVYLFPLCVATHRKILSAVTLFYLIFVQFYTFLETTLVTASLLPNFIAFFSDAEIPGTPGALATTFLAFGGF